VPYSTKPKTSFWTFREGIILEQQTYEGELLSFGFIKKTRSYGNEKTYLLYIFPPELHTYDFVVLTSLTHPRKILLVVLQIGK
jgi:hypothetical protein